LHRDHKPCRIFTGKRLKEGFPIRFPKAKIMVKQ
jgi:hypothetical protein